jgi:hypothetical protein
MTRSRAAVLLVIASAVVIAFGAASTMWGRGAATAARSKRTIDPQADRLLRQMTDYLASLKSFKVRNSSVDEVVTAEGQKIQFVSASDVAVERPNRLRSEQVGAENGLAFWYDGRSMTLACKTNNTYATAPAPATLDDTIDKARKQFQIEAPGADLLYSRPYDILTEQVKSGRVIGRETVDGVPVNHLAFLGDDVDWQIWIKEGAEPLPLRFVITSKTVKGAPEFVVQLTEWQPHARADATTFAFKPAAGATRVDAFPSACSAEARR